MALEHAEFLGLIAQVAATFVGFSLAIGLLQPEHPGAQRRMQSMRAVAELALIAGVGAILALLLNTFDVPQDLNWRWSSTAVGIFWFALHMFASRRFKGAGIAITRTGFLRIAVTVAFTGMLLLLWNAVVGGEMAGARYCAALVLALVDSAFLFVLQTFAYEEQPHAPSA